MGEPGRLKTRKLRTWLIAAAIFICVVFLGLFAGASWMYEQTENARTALQTYGDSLVSKEYEKAYALRDSDLQRLLSESDFRKSHELASSHYGQLEKVVLEPGQKVGGRNGLTVTIGTRVVYEHAEDRFFVTMKKVGATWFVHDARYQGK
ncbi:MAG TPA: hypothetical protein VN734_16370 [Acidobacteriaceae bacterium]|nr:hypothetical protein [Acidobacteriaceae bacterium]